MSIEGPWPDHLLTLAEWEALPEDNSRRFELAEGVLVVAPHPPAGHQWVLTELLVQLHDQLLPELTPLPAVEIVVFEDFPATVRVPDIAVIPEAVLRQRPVRLAARDVVLAIEITAPGTRRIDRVLKLAEYAEAGIENYWIVDLEQPATISAFELVGREYKLVVETSGTLSVTAQVPLTVDVQALFA
ncbi:Uma2 family endonuclease [Actinocrispum wychmicini]|uniref:Uma2 family endonuclease n=1 Tax=Actinocrispum wychmicini TaxID=1213861 RepID=A0A4R2JSV9_9PSEU|nr:Uma2 family endonuclease [Actinocrispum wychmicini]TCO57255.1 Uma2 family endonuclease [Actinocrispum wychmicini]